MSGLAPAQGNGYLCHPHSLLVDFQLPFFVFNCTLAYLQVIHNYYIHFFGYMAISQTYMYTVYPVKQNGHM